MIINGPSQGVQVTEKEDVLVGSAGSIVDAGAGIWSFWGDTRLVIGGSILSQSTGILAGTPRLLGATVHVDVLAGGQVWGSATGLVVGEGALTLTNAGHLSGDTAIKRILADEGGDLVIRNSGRIEGTTFGVHMVNDAQDRSDLWLTNSGTLTGGVAAILVEDADSAATILNYGWIFGDIFLSGANDVLTNRGFIEQAAISMGGGNDFVDNRLGQSDHLLIVLEAGNDTVIGGLNEEEVFGGEGIDTVSYQPGWGVGIDLTDVTANTGAAMGDTYDGIEVFRGSDRGRDWMRGDEAANVFLGGGGRDLLDGAGGADSLTGGAGIDTLTGGLGADRFVFGAAYEGGDLVTDFTRGADKVMLALSGFGAGLALGTLPSGRFLAGAGHQATTTGQRLLFDTTDHSLWFDADGSRAGAAVLLAVFENGVTLSASDILVF